MICHLKTWKQTTKKVTYSQWINRVRIYTNQDKPSRGPDKSGTSKPCFVWIVLSEHKLHFYFLIPRVNKVNTCFEGRGRRSVWHHVIICFFFFFFYSIHVFPENPWQRCEGRMYKTHAEEEEGEEEGSVLKWADNFNFMNLFEFPRPFRERHLNTLTAPGHRQRTSIRPCLVLVDKWVHDHLQAWKCLFLFLVGGGWVGGFLGRLLVFLWDSHYEVQELYPRKGSWNMKNKTCLPL